MTLKSGATCQTSLAERRREPGALQIVGGCNLALGSPTSCSLHMGLKKKSCVCNPMLGWVLCYMEMNQRINAGGLVQTKGPRNHDNPSRTTGFKVSDQCLPLGFLQSGYLWAPREHAAVEGWEGRVKTLLPATDPSSYTNASVPHWAIFTPSVSSLQGVEVCGLQNNYGLQRNAKY